MFLPEKKNRSDFGPKIFLKMGLNPEVSWQFLEKNIPDFNPITEICKLCTREKYQIILNPKVATLNSRLEVFSHCKHKASYVIGDPPD